MLDFQLVQAPFRLGLAEGTDPHHVPVGTLVTAENIEWQKSGRVQKRLGTTALVRTIQGGGSVSAGERLFTRGDELCLINGSTLYAYSSVNAKWTSVDQVPDAGLTWNTLTDSNAGVRTSDAALTAGGYLVHAWTTGDPTQTAGSGRGFVQIIEAETGALVMPPTALASGATSIRGVRVLIVNSVPVVVFHYLSNTVATQCVDLSTLAVGTLQALVTTNSDYFDACVIGARLVIARESAGGGAVITLTDYTVSGTTLSNVTSGTIASEAGTPVGPISIDGADGEVIYIAYWASSTTRVRIAGAHTTTLAETVAPVDVQTGITATQVAVKRTSATTCVIAYTTNETRTATFSATYTAPATIAVTSTSQRGSWSTRLVTRPFLMGSRLFMLLVESRGTSATFQGVNTVLVEVETSTNAAFGTNAPHRYLGKVDLFVGGQTAQGFVGTPPVSSSTKAYVLSPFLATAPPTSTNWRCGTRLVTVTLGDDLPTDFWRTVAWERETYMTAGVLHAYDGRNVFDYGFVRGPEIRSMSTAAGNVVAGDYLFGTVLEYRSAAAMLHRSPFYTTNTVNLAGNSEVTANVTTVSVGSKQDAATGFAAAAQSTLIGYYRTTIGGAILYRLTWEPRFNVSVADSQAASTAVVDNRADTDIDGAGTDLNTRPLPYTAGGILDDEQPPAFVTLALHRSRLWGVSGDRRTLWFSKSFLDDFGVAPGFSSSFRIQVDRDVTALASMDEKLVIFWAGGLWYLLGDGPGPNGDGSDLNGPNPVQTDVGCTQPRSVVATPSGVMFASDDCIHLLTRGLEVVDIGRDVQDQFAEFPVVTSAVLVPARNQVRFTCNDVGGDFGIVLVWHYLEKQWSTFKYYESHSTVASTAFADACMWQGRWTALAPGGGVFYETEGTYLDAGSTWVTLKLETAWISSAGPLAYHSVRRFSLQGISHSNHDLSINVGFNSQDPYFQSADFLAGSTPTSIGTYEACDVSIGTYRKCASIRFWVEDATPTEPGTYPVGTGQGPSFDTMGIEVGIKRGFMKKPATARQ